MKRLLSIFLACLLLTACGQPAPSEPDRRKDSSASQSRDSHDSDRSEDSRSQEDEDSSRESPEEGPLPAISFNHHYDSVEYANIMAFDQNGVVVWEYTTPKLEAAQLDQVEEIGLVGDCYLFNCGGQVIGLNARTGEERWTNSEFGGGQIHFAVQDSTVLLCGFFGPDLFALSAVTGETIHRIDSLDPNYYWPCGMELDGNQVIVSMSGGPDGSLEPEGFCTIRVNLDDWTVDLS